MFNSISHIVEQYPTTTRVLWRAGLMASALSILIYKGTSEDSLPYLWVKPGIGEMVLFMPLLLTTLTMGIATLYQLYASGVSDKNDKRLDEGAGKLFACFGAMLLLFASTWALYLGFTSDPGPRWHQPEGTHEVGVFSAVWAGLATASLATIAWNLKGDKQDFPAPTIARPKLSANFNPLIEPVD